MGGTSFQFHRLSPFLPDSALPPELFKNNLADCRAKRIRLIAYLDNFLLLACSSQELSRQTYHRYIFWIFWIFWTRLVFIETPTKVTSHAVRDVTIWGFCGIQGSFVSFSLKTRFQVSIGSGQAC